MATSLKVIFFSCQLTSKLMLYLSICSIYVCFLLVSTHGIMFEQAKVGIRFKTNYWFFILVHVCYGLEAATNRIFKSKEGNNMKGEYPF